MTRHLPHFTSQSEAVKIRQKRPSAEERREDGDRYLKRRPAISGLGFVLAALRCSRTGSTFRSGARQSLAETRTCRARSLTPREREGGRRALVTGRSGVTAGFCCARSRRGD